MHNLTSGLNTKHVINIFDVNNDVSQECGHETFQLTVIAFSPRHETPEACDPVTDFTTYHSLQRPAGTIYVCEHISEQLKCLFI